MWPVESKWYHVYLEILLVYLIMSLLNAQSHLTFYTPPIPPRPSFGHRHWYLCLEQFYPIIRHQNPLLSPDWCICSINCGYFILHPFVNIVITSKLSNLNLKYLNFLFHPQWGFLVHLRLQPLLLKVALMFILYTFALSVLSPASISSSSIPLLSPKWTQQRARHGTHHTPQQQVKTAVVVEGSKLLVSLWVSHPSCPHIQTVDCSLWGWY